MILPFYDSACSLESLCSWEPLKENTDTHNGYRCPGAISAPNWVAALQNSLDFNLLPGEGGPDDFYNYV